MLIVDMAFLIGVAGNLLKLLEQPCLRKCYLAAVGVDVERSPLRPIVEGILPLEDGYVDAGERKNACGHQASGSCSDYGDVYCIASYVYE